MMLHRSIERAPERDEAVLAALPHVPFEGWTRRALRAGLADLGRDPAEIESLFPDGPAEAVEVWCDLADRRMEAAMAEEDQTGRGLTARVERAVMLRLEEVERHREAVGRALALLALPMHLPASGRTLYRTVDAIWAAAGDRSSDSSWYTKRILLAGVYGTTLAYWLNLGPGASEPVQAFLHRRLQDVLRIGKARQRLESCRPRLPDPARVLDRLRPRPA